MRVEKYKKCGETAVIVYNVDGCSERAFKSKDDDNFLMFDKVLVELKMRGDSYADEVAPYIREKLGECFISEDCWESAVIKWVGQ